MLNEWVSNFSPFQAWVALFILAIVFFNLTKHFKEKEEKEKRAKERDKRNENL